LRCALASAFAAGLLLSPLSGFAATATTNLNVSANVDAACLISTTDLAFGTYDFLVTNRVTGLNGTGSVTVTCTTGTGTNVTLGEGQNKVTSTPATPDRLMANGANRLGYYLYTTAAHATVWGDTVATGQLDTGNGSAQLLTVYGVVTGAQNVPAGTYTDIVIATVTF
jgi:spore coat protein U-like protein